MFLEGREFYIYCDCYLILFLAPYFILFIYRPFSMFFYLAISFQIFPFSLVNYDSVMIS